MSEDVSSKVKKIVADHLGIDESKVTEESSFIDEGRVHFAVCLFSERSAEKHVESDIFFNTIFILVGSVRYLSFNIYLTSFF